MPAQTRGAAILAKAKKKAQLDKAKRQALVARLKARPPTKPSMRGGVAVRAASASNAPALDASRVLASLAGREIQTSGSYNANEQRMRQLEATTAAYQARITEMEQKNREAMETGLKRVSDQVEGLREAYVGGVAPMSVASSDAELGRTARSRPPRPAPFSAPRYTRAPVPDDSDSSQVPLARPRESRRPPAAAAPAPVPAPVPSHPDASAAPASQAP